MITWVKRMMDPGEGLPSEVRAALDGAMVMRRDSDRVYITLAGKSLRCAFLWSAEEATDRVKAYWPDLTQKQLERAVSFIAAQVVLSKREEKRDKRKRWVFDF